MTAKLSHHQSTANSSQLSHAAHPSAAGDSHYIYKTFGLQPSMMSHVAVQILFAQSIQTAETLDRLDSHAR